MKELANNRERECHRIGFELGYQDGFFAGVRAMDKVVEGLIDLIEKLRD